MALIKRQYIINGVSRIVVFDEDDTMAKALRRFGLTGLKVGCGNGQCGACTILVNGKPVRSCVKRMKSVSELDAIETIEGLGTANRLHPLQQAWITFGGVQCGFCSPGFIMSAKGLLNANPQPTREEVRQWFADHHNICRCTGYVPLVDAVMAAAAVMRGEISEDDVKYAIPADGRIYNTYIPRPSALAKVLGQCDYGDDIALKMPEQTLHLAVVWPHCTHANIVGIDASEAEAMPGVVRVLTAADVSGSNDIGPAIPHKRSFTPHYPQPVLCADKVTRLGDPIALVAARTEAEARAAAKKVRVELEPLPEYETYLEAAVPDAVSVHPGAPNVFIYQPLVKGEETGDIIANSAYAVSGSFFSTREPHLALEPWAMQAYYDAEGRLTVQYKGQSLYFAKSMLGKALGVEPDQLRVIETPTGASFGYAITAEAPALVALAALVLKQPVTLTMSLAETIRFTGKRSSAYSNGRMACDEQGRITALEYDMGVDHGSHSRSAGFVEVKICRFIGYPYKIDHIRGLLRAGFSNNAFCTTYRGFGSPQAYTISEALVDMLAEKAGIDPFEFRYINAARPGDLTPNNRPYTPCTIVDILDKLRPHYEEAKQWAAAPARPGKRRGVGVCCGGYHVSSASDKAEVAIELNPDGTVTCNNCWEAQGQGADIGTLVCTHEALRPLGLRPEQIRLDMNDTAYCPETGPAGGSRSHYMAGNATIDAANKLIDAMRKPDGSFRTYAEMAAEGIPTRYIGLYSTAGKYSAIDPNTGEGEGKADQNFVAYVVCVEVDEATGATEVRRVRAAADVGVIGNFLAVEGQAVGGLAHAIGFALTENYSDHDKKYATLNGCGILSSVQLPDDVKFEYVETPRTEGPFGSGGASECFQSSAHVAVINAIHHAVGVRIFDLPATPEKVRAAMEAKAAGKDLTPAPYYLGDPFDEVMKDIRDNPV